MMTRSVCCTDAARTPRFYSADVALMTVMARATGHRQLSEFDISDLTMFKCNVADLAGAAYGGVGSRA